MKRINTFLIALFMLTGFTLTAQVAISTDGSSADGSAMLEVKSNEKGFLLPRMTQAQRDAITPAEGLIIYNSTTNKPNYYNGTEWMNYDATSAHTFECGQSFVDVRDNKSYTTVEIGTQCWMAENLNVGTRIDGATAQADNSTIEKYCYDNDENNCDIYGGLYQWDEMMNYTTTAGVQGICMEGWHLPTDAEWTTLVTYVGNNGFSDTEGTALKSTSLWISGGNGTDNFGFSALPGGYRIAASGVFGYVDYGGYFWSSNESPATNAWYLGVVFNNASVDRGVSHKAYGFSVRCLKD